MSEISISLSSTNLFILLPPILCYLFLLVIFFILAIVFFIAACLIFNSSISLFNVSCNLLLLPPVFFSPKIFKNEDLLINETFPYKKLISFVFSGLLLYLLLLKIILLPKQDILWWHALSPFTTQSWYSHSLYLCLKFPHQDECEHLPQMFFIGPFLELLQKGLFLSLPLLFLPASQQFPKPHFL